MKYARKPTAVEAFRWDRQPQEDWPEWITVYRGRDSMGQLAPIGISNVGTLLVAIDGNVKQVNQGDYLVLESGAEPAIGSLPDRTPFVHGRLLIYTAAAFAENFTEVEDEA